MRNTARLIKVSSGAQMPFTPPRTSCGRSSRPYAKTALVEKWILDLGLPMLSRCSPRFARGAWWTCWSASNQSPKEYPPQVVDGAVAQDVRYMESLCRFSAGESNTVRGHPEAPRDTPVDCPLGHPDVVALCVQ